MSYPTQKLSSPGIVVTLNDFCMTSEWINRLEQGERLRLKVEITVNIKQR